MFSRPIPNERPQEVITSEPIEVAVIEEKYRQIELGDVPDLLLTIDDLPEGWKLKSREELSKYDVTRNELEAGWGGGSKVMFTKVVGGIGDYTGDILLFNDSLTKYGIFSQQVSLYPRYLEQYDSLEEISNREYTFYKLPERKFGDRSAVYIVKIVNTGDISHRLYFYMDGVFVSLSITGGAESISGYELLQDLATNIETKINKKLSS